MKKRSIMLSIGAIISSILSSAAIYAFNVSNSKPSQTTLTSSLKDSYNSNLSENYVSSFPSVNNNLERKNINKFVSVSNGFEDLREYNERLLYTKIKTGADKILDEKSKESDYCIAPIIIQNCHLDIGQVKKVLYAILNDNPELFWFSQKFSCAYTSDKSTIVHLKSTMPRKEKEKAVLKLKNKISEIISKIPSNATEYEKELFLHDYIVDNCTYKIMNNNPNIFNAYGCLVDKVAVCAGYSQAMQLLLSNIGMESRTITGAKGNEAHMWNLVKVNGSWYHLDVTWDNTGGPFSRYNYFNLDDKTIRANHTVNEHLPVNMLWKEDKRYNFALPVCNSKKDNFYEKNAARLENLKDSQTVINSLIKLAMNRKEYFYIKAENIETLENAVKQHLSKIYKFLSEANKVLSKDCKFDTSSSISYSICRPQSVLIIKLNYNK